MGRWRGGVPVGCSSSSNTNSIGAGAAALILAFLRFLGGSGGLTQALPMA